MTLLEALAVLVYERESGVFPMHDINMFKSEREKATIATAKMVVSEAAQKLLRGY
jgi:hypothetical protein